MKDKYKIVETITYITDLISFEDEDLNYEIAKNEFDKMKLCEKDWKNVFNTLIFFHNNFMESISDEILYNENKLKGITVELVCDGDKVEINFWKFEILIDALMEFIQSKEETQKLRVN